SKIAAAILLGEGGAKLLEILNWEPDVYHLNESHGVPLAFYLYNKYKSMEDVISRLVFTNHTPEESGNQKINIPLLEKMGFFYDIPITEIKSITQTTGDELDLTLTALRFSRKASGVSEMHYHTLRKMWSKYEGICPITYITNAQNFKYWHNAYLYEALEKDDKEALEISKLRSKSDLFDIVADQGGEIYNEKICTIVFAK